MFSVFAACSLVVSFDLFGGDCISFHRATDTGWLRDAATRELMVPVPLTNVVSSISSPEPLTPVHSIAGSNPARLPSSFPGVEAVVPDAVLALVPSTDVVPVISVWPKAEPGLSAEVQWAFENSSVVAWASMCMHVALLRTRSKPRRRRKRAH